VALKQTQLVTAVADRAVVGKADADRAATALEEIVLEELGNAQKRAHRRVGSADRARQAGAEEGQKAATPPGAVIFIRSAAMLA
jgi:hypothetical protein